MITVTSVLEELISEHTAVPFSTPLHLINISALARELQPQAEARLQKPIKLSTIVVCLSRVLTRLPKNAHMPPQVRLDTFSVQTGLIVLTYAKTPEAITLLEKLQKENSLSQTAFFAFTHGVGEVTIIAQGRLLAKIKAAFNSQKPKYEIANAGSLTVQFSEKYIKIPNVIFAILQTLAARNLNVIEIASTLTELTVILDESDLEMGMQLLRRAS